MNLPDLVERVPEAVTGFSGRAVPHKQPEADRQPRIRAEPLGFRLDEETRELIERAAYLERRKLTDFCITELADAARRAIAEDKHLCLSEQDRRAFFDALINPPEPSERLVRAVAEHRRRIAR